MLEIHVTTYNRKEITERCLTLLKQFSSNHDIHIHDDGSNEYNEEWLKGFANKVTVSNLKERSYGQMLVSIDQTMIKKIAEFRDSKYDFLYECDNDVLHDPLFLDKAFELYNEYGLPVTLYKTRFHYRKSFKDIFKQASFPGCSLLLHKSHVASLSDEKLFRKYSRSWDWHIGELLQEQGLDIVCPKLSYCDHYASGGIHGESRDIGEDVTEFLIKERIKFQST